MVTLRNKRKLADLNKKSSEEHLRSSLTQNRNFPRSQEAYITQVSEKTEGRIIKKLSKEFSRTENRIIGALSQPDEFHLNPLIKGYSETTPKTSRTTPSTNQGTNEDGSQSDPHSKAGVFQSQTTHVFGPEDAYDKAQRMKNWLHK